MHELSIALSLVDAACEEVEHAGAPRLRALHVRVGALAGVEREVLISSFEIATADTPIAGARLEIEDVPVSVHCPRCAGEREAVSASDLRCGACGTATREVVHGRELELQSLDVEDDDADEELFPGHDAGLPARAPRNDHVSNALDADRQRKIARDVDR